MKKTVSTLTIAAVLTLAAAGSALATPSTQVWIPSTDIQAYKTFHLNFDTYVRTSKAQGDANYIVMGPTFGVLPFEKVQAEVGFDYIDSGRDSAADKAPIYFHAKVGTPEDSLFKYSPALAVGSYNMGTKLFVTTQNIGYGLVARTLPIVGRLSAGGYSASESVLGKGQAAGVMASWDRTMSEISDKLWVAVDYMSGKNANGALSFGASWAFAKNVSVIFGYDIYNNTDPTTLGGGKNTFTTQVDINFP